MNRTNEWYESEFVDIGEVITEGYSRDRCETMP